MSYNGSGTFQINSSGQPVVTGTVISSTAFNALTADLATGLSTAVTKDGQTTTTARVPFAQGISSTLVTDATSATTGSIITAGGISTQKALWVGTTTTLAGTLTAAAIAGSGNYTLTNSVNGDAQVYILNSNGGASADAILRTSNGTNVGYFGSNGTGAATAGVLNANNAFVRGTHGLSLCADTGAVSVGTTSAEWARFSSGNLGIGVTPSAWSSVTGLQTGLGGSFVGNTGASTAYVISNAYYNGSAWKAINTGASCSMQLDNVGQCLWSTAASVSAGSTVSFGEVARIGSDGSFLVGTTTNGGWPGARVASQGSGFNWYISAYNAGSAAATGAYIARVDNTNPAFMSFRYSTSEVGAITTNGTITVYGTTSDYRLKENVKPMTDGLATVAALKPVIYEWISNGSAGKGFIAHELQAVIPEAVRGEKDAVNEDGSINAQNVDFSKIVPHLVAAIQELTTRLAALETK